MLDPKQRNEHTMLVKGLKEDINKKNMEIEEAIKKRDSKLVSKRKIEEERRKIKDSI